MPISTYSQRASKDSIIVSDGQPIESSGCVNLSVIIVMEISKVTRITVKVMFLKKISLFHAFCSFVFVY